MLRFSSPVKSTLPINLRNCHAHADLGGYSVSGVAGLSHGILDLRVDDAQTGQMNMTSTANVMCEQMYGIEDPDSSTVHTGVLTLVTQGRFDIYDISYVLGFVLSFTDQFD